MSTQTYSPTEIWKGALTGGVINAIINGLINWFQVKNLDSVLVTDNLISSEAHTLFSGAVPLAVSLAFILSGVAYATTKIPNKPPYFPRYFLKSLQYAFSAFGMVVTLGVLWQRWVGSVEISPVMAAVWAGIIAGIVAFVVNLMVVSDLTKR
ncbi:hypothetical protein [Algoriphagus formosus]|uniref:Uncharacterized protein n=1 Tax=Algoriphagus formosus TaxID=2007308 RepID=A0A4R5V004_9BACT|nr:hypothetical protein [Algoriphagus aquimaris]TDK44735.1 hypothetical protein E1898_09160 [Algoriphagus aquimaris]